LLAVLVCGVVLVVWVLVGLLARAVGRKVVGLCEWGMVIEEDMPNVLSAICGDHCLAGFWQHNSLYFDKVICVENGCSEPPTVSVPVLFCIVHREEVAVTCCFVTQYGDDVADCGASDVDLAYAIIADGKNCRGGVSGESDAPSCWGHWGVDGEMVDECRRIRSEPV